MTYTVSPLHRNLQVVNFQRCECECQHLCASSCTVLLYFSRYWTVRLTTFLFVFYIHSTWVKSIINLSQYSTL